VLLLDEPFGALDAMTREQISLDLLRMWSQERQTVLMVTHDINEAVLLSDRVLVMTPRPGQIAADVPVNLPRPRALDAVYTDAFADIARQVRSAIMT
jgi:NitT/TauT family transport system ATP-binding protein